MTEDKPNTELALPTFNSKEEFLAYLIAIPTESLTPAERQKVRDYLVESLVEKARTHFYTFVQLMAPALIPEGFKDGRHIKIMCEALQELAEDVAAGNTPGLKEKHKSTSSRRLQIFMPPGSMKTLVTSRLFPAWFFGYFPTARILHIGHGTQFAEDNFGRPLKSLLMMDEYQVIFPGIEIKKDESAAGRWSTIQGGQYYAAGVGASIAGRRAHVALCLKEDNLVFTKQRGWTQIKDVNCGDEIRSKKGFNKIVNKVVNHHKVCYCFNQQVDTSPEHPLFVRGRGWVEAKEIQVGDKLEVLTLWQRIKHFFRKLRLTRLGEE